MTQTTREIPRASGWPLLGPLPALLRRPLEFLEQARERHGDIYTLNLGVFKAVVLNHPRHAQHVLRDRVQNYRKGGVMWDTLRDILGNGLPLSEGDIWLRRRRMMQPHFDRQRLAGLAELMLAEIDRALTTWAPSADGRSFDLLPAFNDLTLRVVTSTLFGAEIPAEILAEIRGSITHVTDNILPHSVLHGVPAWLPVPGRRRFRAAQARYERLVYDVIADVRRRGGEDAPHLLAMLVNMVDAETCERMTDRQVHAEVATFFLAGYDTTALTLTWTVDELLHRPDVARTLIAEVDRVLAGRAPTPADLPRLTYTRMVLQEILRVRPPAYWLPRIAVADDEIDGHTIAAGANIVIVPYIYHRHPEFWPDAGAFIPERFAPDHPAAKSRHSCAWMPFGAGQRVCIGREFALMEATFALARLVQRYQLSAVSSEPARPQLSGTLRPKGVRVRLTPRSIAPQQVARPGAGPAQP